MEDKLSDSSGKNHFPIDGFVLDAFLVRNFRYGRSAQSHRRDDVRPPKNFLYPAQAYIPNMRDQKEGLGLMLHEDPFVNDWLDLVRARCGIAGRSGSPKENSAPTVIDNYLGKVGIIDWSNQTDGFLFASRVAPLPL